MGKADFAVFVGRFQPVHRAHLQVMEDALKVEADRLIVVIGSHRSPRSLRNPWSFEQRRGMLLAALPEALHGRVDVVPLRDFTYSDTHWAVGLQNVVRRTTAVYAVDPSTQFKVRLVGHLKDDSSRYLEWFPQWELARAQGVPGVNSRDIRNDYFGGHDGWEAAHSAKMHPSTVEFLSDFRKMAPYAELAAEARFLREYKKRWEAAPFPPTFVTTDCVVVKGGHVLLVRRGMNPGKGRLALPGGFVKQDRSILRSALDELKEETNIVYPRRQLELSIRGTRVFDHPERDMRGRVITHAFHMRLPAEGALPEVTAGDDAAEAFWLPIAELPLHEEQFYSDHFHVIDSFVHGDGADL